MQSWLACLFLFLISRSRGRGGQGPTFQRKKGRKNAIGETPTTGILDRIKYTLHFFPRISNHYTFQKFLWHLHSLSIHWIYPLKDEFFWVGILHSSMLKMPPLTLLCHLPRKRETLSQLRSHALCAITPSLISTYAILSLLGIAALIVIAYL